MLFSHSAYHSQTLTLCCPRLQDHSCEGLTVGLVELLVMQRAELTHTSVWARRTVGYRPPPRRRHITIVLPKLSVLVSEGIFNCEVSRNGLLTQYQVHNAAQRSRSRLISVVHTNCKLVTQAKMFV